MSLVHSVDILDNEKDKDVYIKRYKPDGSRVRLSDVLAVIPSGYILKSETGMGATYLELNSERNSIIVEPLKVTAASKSFKHKNSFYVGSSTDLIKSPSNEEILDYCNDAEIPFKKIIVVADSLPKLHYLLGNKMFDDYFLLVDEIDSFQLDAGFRDKMEQCIDIYKFFPPARRALLSATSIKFSDPELQAETRTELFYEWQERADVNVLCTDNVRSLGYEKIVEILVRFPKDKVMVAFNSVDGCKRMAEKLVQEDIVQDNEVRILCSATNRQQAQEYYHELKHDKLPAKVSFFTSAYFTGFDLNDSYHLIILSSNDKRMYSLSDGKIKQIAGRCRQTLLSYTVIHDLVPAREMYKKDATLENLLVAAEKELSALRCIEKNFADEPLLFENLEQIRELVVKNTKKDGFPLVRERYPKQAGYGISYFNIDAYLEDVRVRQTLYMYPIYLANSLDAFVDTQFDEVDSSIPFDERENIKQEREKTVLEVLQFVRNSDKETLVAHLKSKNIGRAERVLIEIYLENCDYINGQQILEELEKRKDHRDSRSLNNLKHAMYFESLAEDNIFKLLVKKYFLLKHRYSGKQLLHLWNIVFVEAGMHYRLKGEVAAKRLTNTYFKTARQRENQLELNGMNPFNLKVIKRRQELRTLDDALAKDIE